MSCREFPCARPAYWEARFGGTTSWEQYRQVFDAIVLSNGWDDATAALTAALPPGGRCFERGLVSTDVSSDIENGSGGRTVGTLPGRLADYRWKFEKTTRTAEEDPSIFAIALETLVVKAFGDMGQTARLRLIRDRFIAGHNSCELRRYLDSVPPETPMWTDAESRRPRDSTGQ